MGLVGCASDDDEHGPDVPHLTLVPPLTLPADCDEPLPTADMFEAGTTVDANHDFFGMRAVGDTVYFVDTGGVYSVDVPGGERRLLVPNPPVRGHASSSDAGAPDGGQKTAMFDDLWVDETSILAVSSGVLYRAPRSGGAAEWVAGDANAEPFATGFAKFGDFVYYADFERSWKLFRVPVAGGPVIIVDGVDAEYLESAHLVPGSSELFYWQAFGPWGTIALDGEGGTGTKLGEARLLGADEFAYVMTYASGELTVPPHYEPSVLQRVDASGEIHGESASLPANVELPLTVFSETLVNYQGDQYFVAKATYQLPDDKRTEDRLVLMRYSPDPSSLELVRCIPPPPFDPLLTAGGQVPQIEGIAATDTGIFIIQQRDPFSTGRAIRRSVVPQAVKVWP